MKVIKAIFYISAIFSGCEKSGSDIQIDPDLSYEFVGKFTITNTLQSGTVYLNIDSGRYYCSTELPFGRGAGRLEADNNEI